MKRQLFKFAMKIKIGSPTKVQIYILVALHNLSIVKEIFHIIINVFLFFARDHILVLSWCDDNLHSDTICSIDVCHVILFFTSNSSDTQGSNFRLFTQTTVILLRLRQFHITIFISYHIHITFSSNENYANQVEKFFFRNLIPVCFPIIKVNQISRK